MFVCIIITSLFITCRPYRDRQNPANGTQCPNLTIDMDYQIGMVTHGRAFVEPVGGTGWSKSVTRSLIIETDVVLIFFTELICKPLSPEVRDHALK